MNDPEDHRDAAASSALSDVPIPDLIWDGLLAWMRGTFAVIVRSGRHVSRRFAGALLVAFGAGVPAALGILMVLAWRDYREPVATWGDLLLSSLRLTPFETLPLGYLLWNLTLARQLAPGRRVLGHAVSALSRSPEHSGGEGGHGLPNHHRRLPRTLADMPLPPGERFDLEYVKGTSWNAYNWYKGGYHSLIQVNLDFPVPLDRAIDLACHEGYPGHHVYNARLEQALVRRRGWVEISIYPLFSPQSFIAEGSANYGIDMAFPASERTAFERDSLFPLAGLDRSLAERNAAVLQVLARVPRAPLGAAPATRAARAGSSASAAA